MSYPPYIKDPAKKFYSSSIYGNIQLVYLCILIAIIKDICIEKKNRTFVSINNIKYNYNILLIFIL